MKFTTTRKKTQAIAGAEWKITALLDVDGVVYGQPVEIRMADSQLASDPSGVGQLIGARLDEAALAIKRAGLVPKRKRVTKAKGEHA